MTHSELLPLPPKVRKAIQIAAEEAGTTVSMLFGPDRHKKTCQGRRLAIRYLLRMEFSRAQIGRFLGIHHTSVLNHERRDIMNAEDTRGNGLTAAWRSQIPPKAPVEIPCPDLSGEWAI